MKNNLTEKPDHEWHEDFLQPSGKNNNNNKNHVCQVF